MDYKKLKLEEAEKKQQELKAKKEEAEKKKEQEKMDKLDKKKGADKKGSKVVGISGKDNADSHDDPIDKSLKERLAAGGYN